MWDDLVVSAGGDGAIKFWTLDGDCVFTIAADSAQPKGILKIDLAAHMVRLFFGKRIHCFVTNAA
jgi:hypothetical protein